MVAETVLLKPMSMLLTTLEKGLSGCIQWWTFLTARQEITFILEKQGDHFSPWGLLLHRQQPAAHCRQAKNLHFGLYLLLLLFYICILPFPQGAQISIHGTFFSFYRILWGSLGWQGMTGPISPSEFHRGFWIWTWVSLTSICYLLRHYCAVPPLHLFFLIADQILGLIIAFLKT